MAERKPRTDARTQADSTGAETARRAGGALALPGAASEDSLTTAEHQALMERLGLRAVRGEPKHIGCRYDLRGRRWDFYQWGQDGQVVEAGPFVERR